MKLHVFSDLHDGFPGSWRPELAAGADVVVCAGDVCEGLPEAMAFLREAIPAPMPIITVAGNHSFYRRVMNEQWADGRAAAHQHGVTLLENEAVLLGSVRFIGATLWTDYAVYGDRERGPAMERAARELNDHRMIMWRRTPRERFMPAHALELHIDSAAAIDELLAQPFGGPTVVVTHHAPSPLSIAQRYTGDGLNPAFCSDLSDMIRQRQLELWVHGHMHSSADYRIGRTRVVNNPHGYGQENAGGFDPGMVLDVNDGR